MLTRLSANDILPPPTQCSHFFPSFMPPVSACSRSRRWRLTQSLSNPNSSEIVSKSYHFRLLNPNSSEIVSKPYHLRFLNPNSFEIVSKPYHLRYLRHQGYEVYYVRNFTDVDDKIIARVNELGEDPISLSKRFCNDFLQDMAYLHCLPISVEPNVSDHIPQIVDMFKQAIFFPLLK